MVKSAKFFHGILQGAFTGMPKRRMPEVMRQSNSFAEFFVQAQTFADGACNLSYLNTVR